jgi:hypothetical protein
LGAGFGVREHDLRGDAVGAEGWFASGIKIEVQMVVGALGKLEEPSRDPEEITP